MSVDNLHQRTHEKGGDKLRILALDPGEETGYAIVDVSEQKLSLADYGVIPITEAGLGGMLRNIWAWLEARPVDSVRCIGAIDSIVFEEFIPSQRLRTTREAAEARGIIRLWGHLHIAGLLTTYYPQAVRSALGLNNKSEIRKWIQDFLGFKVRGKDHVTDAIAVAMCHAVKLGLWYPNKHTQREGDFSITRNLGGRQIKASTVEDVAKLRGDDLGRAINSGRVRVGKR